jgi:hypothetical protein
MSCDANLCYRSFTVFCCDIYGKLRNCIIASLSRNMYESCMIVDQQTSHIYITFNVARRIVCTFRVSYLVKLPEMPQITRPLIDSLPYRRITCSLISKIQLFQFDFAAINAIPRVLVISGMDKCLPSSKRGPTVQFVLPIICIRTDILFVSFRFYVKYCITGSAN